MRAIGLALCLAACALTSRSAPLELHYYAPAVAEVAPRRGTCRARVRIARVTTGDLLGWRIVHRESAVELAPYDTRRWAELPDRYVERALARALFDERRLRDTTDAGAPGLDVDIVAFEEIHRGAQHGGRVELDYALRDAETVRAHGSIAQERMAEGADFANVVAAIGAAMTAAVAQVADRVATELCR